MGSEGNGNRIVHAGEGSLLEELHDITPYDVLQEKVRHSFIYVVIVRSASNKSSPSSLFYLKHMWIYITKIGPFVVERIQLYMSRKPLLKGISKLLLNLHETITSYLLENMLAFAINSLSHSLFVRFPCIMLMVCVSHRAHLADDAVWDEIETERFLLSRI